MKQQTFESLHGKVWQEFEQQVQQQEQALGLLSSFKRTETDSSAFPQQYRQICHLRSMAEERHYSQNLIKQLDALAIRGYQVLYRPRPNTWQEFVQFIVRGFPARVRAERNFVLVSFLLLVVPAIIMGLGVHYKPELIYSILPMQEVDRLETSYRADNKVFGEARDSDTDFQMFGFYISHNIGLAFKSFALGLAFGVGAVFYGVVNGVLLGGMSSHIVNIGYSLTFFSFIVTHGSVELTALVLANAAGLKLGWPLVSPGQLTRAAALQAAARPALQLMYGAFAFLVLAAFIEAYWSSSSVISSTIKFTVGSLCWFLVLYYLLRAGKQSAALPGKGA